MEETLKAMYNVARVARVAVGSTLSRSRSRSRSQVSLSSGSLRRLKLNWPIDCIALES